jgi:hypothetical protein
MTKAKETKKGEVAIVTEEETALALPFDYGTDAGVGTDDITRDDMAIPFITPLQALSPQIKAVDKGGIEGAEVGMLINTVSNEVYAAVGFIPAAKTTEFVEWIPRDQGGGFVAAHSPMSEIVLEAMARAKETNAKFGKYTTLAGNDLVETRCYYGVPVDEDMNPLGVAVLAFTSSKIKKFKKLNTQLKSIKGRPPVFSIHLVVSSVLEKNNKGQEYQNFEIKFANGKGIDSLIGPDTEAFQSAKALRNSIEAGLARADHGSTTNDAPAEEDDGDHF